MQSFVGASYIKRELASYLTNLARESQSHKDLAENKKINNSSHSSSHPI